MSKEVTAIIKCDVPGCGNSFQSEADILVWDDDYEVEPMFSPDGWKSFQKRWLEDDNHFCPEHAHLCPTRK